MKNCSLITQYLYDIFESKPVAESKTRNAKKQKNPINGGFLYNHKLKNTLDKFKLRIQTPIKRKPVITSRIKLICINILTYFNNINIPISIFF